MNKLSKGDPKLFSSSHIPSIDLSYILKNIFKKNVISFSSWKGMCELLGIFVPVLLTLFRLLFKYNLNTVCFPLRINMFMLPLKAWNLLCETEPIYFYNLN